MLTKNLQIKLNNFELMYENVMVKNVLVEIYFLPVFVFLHYTQNEQIFFNKSVCRHCLNWTVERLKRFPRSKTQYYKKI